MTDEELRSAQIASVAQQLSDKLGLKLTFSHTDGDLDTGQVYDVYTVGKVGFFTIDVIIMHASLQVSFAYDLAVIAIEDDKLVCKYPGIDDIDEEQYLFDIDDSRLTMYNLRDIKSAIFCGGL